NGIAADGSRLVLSARKAVHVWDTVAAGLVGTIRLKGFPNAILLSPDATKVAIDGGTTLYIHDLTTLALVAKWKTKYCYYPRLAWSPDSRLLARIDRSTSVCAY